MRRPRCVGTTSIALLRVAAGRFTVAVRFAWAGDAHDGAAAIAPIRALAAPLIDTVRTIPFTDIGTVHSDPADPLPAYQSCELLRDVPAGPLLEVAGPDAGSPQVIVEIRRLGGAIAEPPRHPDALCHRDAAFTLLTIGVPAPPTAAHTARLRDALAPWITGGCLPNLASGTGPERMARCYHPGTLSRLAEVAQRYDPAHVLRAGQVPIRNPR